MKKLVEVAWQRFMSWPRLYIFRGILVVSVIVSAAIVRVCGGNVVYGAMAGVALPVVGLYWIERRARNLREREAAAAARTVLADIAASAKATDLARSDDK